MTNVKPDVAPNGRYSQAEAARLLGASRKTLYSGSEILRAWMEN
jgi:hypothetical protein